MSFRLGLTGGIGMGKTTTAAMFASRGVPVWDADTAVHRLYAAGAAAVEPVAAVFPSALGPQGIDRTVLKRLLAEDPSRLARLEAIVHPLVAADRQAFIGANAAAPVVLLDIPLLFETGAEAQMDGVAVVSARAEIQRARVLSRPGMDEATLDLILSRQMADAERRARATWIIPTATLAEAEAAVDAILAEIAARKTRTHA
ncbi:MULTISPECIES: dephospho-CoA kinase [unclassified Paracoccus (in: a-proteobacteria)]|uniref:dephospho-CoA kinase n=1 Tax=unclassified Paracoccus (in: a-proteobacteria) TaxID=2688777 RepID=UPI001603E960|nr:MULTISPECIES: dephospho-CoA kinase [unclassified Paracoccus (in: a-proteobacteria)]MBB1492055.1 dephospho-CoA kinase [Paracoccus sp. MC1854]MBB1497941.1 dephospho-CoA kinase [Paracoccus sp. MC1862]QQO44328.1 dephospho-CoA kinase [Paracoccus sp. MC1862]